MALKRLEKQSRGAIPEANAEVISPLSAGGHELAVRGEGHGPYQSVMSSRLERVSRRHVPQTNDCIIAQSRRSQRLAVGGKGEAMKRMSRPVDTAEFPAGGNVPEA